MSNAEYFKTYWAPYLKASYCNIYSACGYKSNCPFVFPGGYPYQAELITPNIAVFFNNGRVLCQYT